MLAKLLIQTNGSSKWEAVTEPRYVRDPETAFAGDILHHATLNPSARFAIVEGEQAAEDSQ